MITLGDMPLPSPSDCAALCADRWPPYALHEPAGNSAAEEAMRWQFGQKVFRIEDGVFLRIKEPLDLSFDGRFVIVDGWGLRLPVGELQRLDAELVRHFLLLQGKAERNSLSEEEHSAWICIVDSIDYQRLCVDRSRPVYVEGTVCSAGQDGAITVEWQDGKREWLPHRVANGVSCLRPGDAFSAFARKNHRGQTTRIEGVASLGRADDLYSAIPADWPPVLMVAEEDGT